MQHYVDALNIGPWFVSGPFVPAKGFYRGEPTDMSLTLAVAFTGHMMVELIEQHDTKPSVYQETIKLKGHGFHHWEGRGGFSRSHHVSYGRGECRHRR